MNKIKNIKFWWLFCASLFTIILTIFYIILHLSAEEPGYEEKYLNREQLSTINTIINQEEDTLSQYETKDFIIKYLKKGFSINDDADIIQQINISEIRQMQIIFPTYPIKTTSYFWLDDKRVLLEIVFWSLFGLISNLMFSVPKTFFESSDPKFDPSRIPEHIGKIFYTPFLAIIIFLSINALSNSGSVSFEGIGKGVIVLAFILGFYTRRSIILLSRVKDLILPKEHK